MPAKFMSNLICLVGAGLAIFLGQVFPFLGYSIFALLLGLLLGQFYRVSDPVQAGFNAIGKRYLQYSVVFLGFSLSFAQVSQVGLSSLRLSLVTILLAFLVATLVGLKLGLQKNLALLIGFGTAICGGSAIAAASPILEAKEEEVALSISTIFFFNILALLIFPSLGHLFQMTDTAFGTWAGTAINDTSSVLAAGYSYSQAAGDMATIVKLSRALMIVPACLLFVFYRYRLEKSAQKKLSLRKIIPWFILFFILASLLASLGLVPSAFLPYAKLLSQWLMAMALFAIGSKVSFQQFYKTGLAPLLTGLLAWLAVSLLSFFLIG